jgi:hypothetical protein
VQCKFTRKADKTVTLASLSDALDNARSSAKQGLADSYLLFTNSTLTGTTPLALTARTFVDRAGEFASASEPPLALVTPCSCNRSALGLVFWSPARAGRSAKRKQSVHRKRGNEVAE